MKKEKENVVRVEVPDNLVNSILEIAEGYFSRHKDSEPSGATCLYALAVATATWASTMAEEDAARHVACRLIESFGRDDAGKLSDFTDRMN